MTGHKLEDLTLYMTRTTSAYKQSTSASSMVSCVTFPIHMHTQKGKENIETYPVAYFLILCLLKLLLLYCILCTATLLSGKAQQSTPVLTRCSILQGAEDSCLDPAKH